MTGNAKYQFGARLGGGGMAEVFSARTLGQEGFSRPVAIKRVLASYSSDPHFARMFVAEAQISARLFHPNIVATLDFDRGEDGSLFLVMELVDGVDLDELVKAGPLPVPVAIYIASEMLRGLGYAHTVRTSGESRGVIHRDVSPHNVLLSWEGDVKVSDFGLAKALSLNETTGLILKGKPAYMSPEQANAMPLDHRSDLFAVGIVLWEMLTGQRLFQNDDSRATLAAIFFRPIASPRTLRPEIPAELDRITMKLLERDLDARYPSAELAVQDLLALQPGTRDALVALMLTRFSDRAPSRGHRLVPEGPLWSSTLPARLADAPRPKLRRWLAVLLVGAFAGAFSLWLLATCQSTNAEPMAISRQPMQPGIELPLSLSPRCRLFFEQTKDMVQCDTATPAVRADIMFQQKQIETLLERGAIAIDPALADRICDQQLASVPFTSFCLAATDGDEALEQTALPWSCNFLLQVAEMFNLCSARDATAGDVAPLYQWRRYLAKAQRVGVSKNGTWGCDVEVDRLQPLVLACRSRSH